MNKKLLFPISSVIVLPEIAISLVYAMIGDWVKDNENPLVGFAGLKVLCNFFLGSLTANAGNL